MASINVTFNGLLLDREGFCEALNIDDLLFLDGGLRGEDWTEDGVEGDTFRSKVRGSAVAVCSFLIQGFRDHAGVAHPYRWAGLRDNVEHIRATVKDATEDAPQLLVVTYDDGATRSGLAWCRKVDVVEHDGDRTGVAKRLILDIRVPAGVLT